MHALSPTSWSHNMPRSHGQASPPIVVLKETCCGTCVASIYTWIILYIFACTCQDTCAYTAMSMCISVSIPVYISVCIYIIYISLYWSVSFYTAYWSVSTTYIFDIYIYLSIGHSIHPWSADVSKASQFQPSLNSQLPKNIEAHQMGVFYIREKGLWTKSVQYKSMDFWTKYGRSQY